MDKRDPQDGTHRMIVVPNFSLEESPRESLIVLSKPNDS